MKMLPRCLWVMAALLVQQGLFGGALAAGEKPPNVVVIISDNQGWWEYGFMGSKHFQTPNLDKLATQGLTFTRGYVPMSLCRPSQMTLISGLQTHQHKIVGNDPAPPATPAMREKLISHIDRIATLPKLLAKRGYVSHQSGKWWEGSFRRGGFTEGMTRGFPHPGGRHGDDGLKIGHEGTGMKPVFDFIDRATSDHKPFFLWFAPQMPHSPFDPPARLLEKYKPKTDSIEKARYYAQVEEFDETCGKLLKYLDKQSLRENTLVVYICDNGCYQDFREEYPGKSNRTAYDGGVRTPLMVRWPGRIEPSRDERTLVSSIDLAPTILAACGLEATPEMSGVNLLDAQTLAKRQRVFGEIFSHDVMDIDDPDKSLLLRWCIEGRWKLILLNTSRFPDRKIQLRPNFTFVPDEVELYDLIDDPYETKNIARDHPQRVAKMRCWIDAWRSAN